MQFMGLLGGYFRLNVRYMDLLGGCRVMLGGGGGYKTRESRSPATAKLSPGMGIGRDAD